MVTVDSVVKSGNFNGVTSFSFANTTGTNANRAAYVVVLTADLPPVSVTLGGQSLTQLVSGTDPVYNIHNASVWLLLAPPSGDGTVQVTLSAPTQFHSTSRGASAVAYNLSGVDQSAPNDGTAVVANSYYQQSTSQSLTLTTASPNDLVLSAIMISDTSDEANVTAWPGNEDALYIGSVGHVSLYSSQSDSGPAGSRTLSWTWQNTEPSVAVSVAVKAAAAAPPPGGSIVWSSGTLAARPGSAQAGVLSLYAATDVKVLFWSLGGGWS